MVYQVSTREFRDRQRSLLDLVDKGARVVIRRARTGKSYAVLPITEKDLYLTPEMEAKVALAEEQIRNGEVYEMKDSETLEDFMDRMDDEIQD